MVTTSALLDLVSANFIRELSLLIKKENEHSPTGLYSALNYNGRIEWTPFHPLDPIILESFNNDQHRDKGFGPALGPDATAFLKGQFQTADFECFSARSPWSLTSTDHLLIESLIDGISEMALSSAEIAHSKITDWKAFRMKNVRYGTCIVGHVDVLVLPRVTINQAEN